MSQWKTLFKHLVKKGFDTYSPGQHRGECQSAYVVVRFAGSSSFGSFSSNQNLYEVMCYVPRDSYSTLEDYADRVRSAVLELYPMFVPTGFETAAFYDDTVKAHMISIEYRNSVRRSHSITLN